MQQKSGQCGASTHPFGPGTPPFSMPPLRSENGPGTVWEGYEQDQWEEEWSFALLDFCVDFHESLLEASTASIEASGKTTVKASM